MSLSAAEKEAYARAHVDTVQKHCIEMRHVSFPNGVLRVVNHDIDLWVVLEAGAPVDASTLVMFTGIAADIAPPSVSDTPENPFLAVLDGVGDYLQSYLYNASQYINAQFEHEVVEMTIRPVTVTVSDDSTQGVTSALHLELLGASMDIDTIKLSSGFSHSSKVAFPGVFFTPDSHPDLY